MDADFQAAIDALGGMTEAQYRDMIERDIEWLRRQPASLHRHHIEAVLRDSLLGQIRVVNTTNGETISGGPRR